MFKWVMGRSIRFLALSLLTIGLMVACNPQSNPSQTAQPLTVGSSPWPGFAGHYVAVAQDFFQDEGITVTDNYFQVATDVNTALLAGRLDLALTGGPDMVVMASQDPSLRFIMLTDYSNGADGILARNIDSPADLRGKNVAWESLPLQAMLLQRYLESGGLSQDDINLQLITAAEAATAFASQNIDVAITYEPWLTTAATQGQGQVIFSSKDTNIIPVGVVAKAAVIEARREEILAFMRAIDRGVNFLRENPNEANAIVAEKLGVPPEEVPQQLSTVRLFDIEENQTIGFNPDDALNVIESLEFAAETSEAIGLIPNAVNASSLYDDSLVNAL
jgi:NitT/TauT family transport system substrate-binding protein